ncbi:hypothetical protein [Bacillus sp. AFS040349]|uniref:hypothetical protein n=1 Tax=Bacillus sp. AFS040349 TaxID=2033502 RepID=UPI000BFEA0CE|nr:hypothetical protein [Bacillus sp. AFS040349]PGT82199.1 hypothetical protein COD11_15500 [Bacillus sp. AFS040349]
MEMDVYEKSSHEYTISNLYMLKIFHDMGVDVTKLGVNSFQVDVNFSNDSGYDIFRSSIDALFLEVKYCDYESCGIDEEFAEICGSNGTPELMILIKDPLFQRVIKSQFYEDIKTLIVDESKSFETTEADFDIPPKKDGLLISIWFTGMFHELALGVMNIRNKILEFIKQLEEENNGVSDQNNRQVA